MWPEALSMFCMDCRLLDEWKNKKELPCNKQSALALYGSECLLHSHEETYPSQQYGWTALTSSSLHM